MKILNLVDIDKSDIKYQIQKFPDGQQNVVIGGLTLQSNWFHYILPSLKDGVQIKSRLNNWLDLELIVCTTKSLRNLGVKEIHLYVPYILGARSDRKFEKGGNRYIKDVIAPVLNSLKFESVTCIDPHSYVLENCINNFESMTNEQLVRETFRGLYGLAETYKNGNDKFIIIAPDSGSLHKIYKLAEQIGYKGDIITCNKERDADGKIIGVEVPEFDVSKDIIIIDDILDYGNTFNNIAGRMNDAEHKGKKYLIISHAIQDAGLENSLRWFDGIYTTNSYKSRESNEKIKILNVF